MLQVQLVNKVVEWERRLQMEKERRDNLKGEPYKMAASTSSKKERLATLHSLPSVVKSSNLPMSVPTNSA